MTIILQHDACSAMVAQAQYMVQAQFTITVWSAVTSKHWRRY